jgi:uncharacterized membrane protein
MAMPPVSQPIGRPADHRPSGPSLQLHAKRTARRLAWFSIARGLLQVLRPGDFARAIGTRGSVPARLITRLGGLREIAAGVGILTTPRPATWLSSRVAGDMMDLGLLGVAFTAPSARRSRLLAAMAAVAGATVLDARCAQRLTGPPSTSGRAVRSRRSITINRTAEELYRFWRDLSNLPRFMEKVESVSLIDDRRSRWIARGPLGMRFEWEAELTEDRPNQLIAWRSVPGSQLDSAGVVRFQPAPGGRGTEVVVELEYTPPGQEVAAQLARLIGQAPEQQLQQDLRRVKQLMETGQIIEARPALQSVEGGLDTRRSRSRTPRAVSVVRGGSR